MPDSWDGLADTRIIRDFILLVERNVKINANERFFIFEIQIHIKGIDNHPAVADCRRDGDNQVQAGWLRKLNHGSQLSQTG